VSSSAQITGYNIFATTGSNQFDGSQAITGSLTVTGQVVAQTLNVQQVTSSIVYSSGSNVFGNSLGNTQQFTGSVSVTGSLAVAGALSSGTLTINGADNRINSGNELRFYRTDNAIYTRLYDGGNANGFVLDNRNGEGFSFQAAGTNQLRIASTGAATFSSSVTATTLTLSTTTADYAATITNVQDSSQGLLVRATDNDSSLYLLNLQSSGGATSQTWVDRFAVTKQGNVGIGTPSPGERLTIQSAASGTAPQLKLENPVDSNSSQGAANNLSAGQLLFGATGAFPLTSRIESVYNSDASFGRSADLVFSGANGSGTLSERMRITSGGEVNIGGFGTIFPVLTVKGIASSPHIGSTWSVSANQDGTGRTIIGTAGQGRSMYFENNGDIVIPNNTLEVGGSVRASSFNTSTKTSINQNSGTVSANTATTIFTRHGSGNGGAFVLVTGATAAGNWFFDTVAFLNDNAATAISSQIGGSPPSRSYSVSGQNLRLTVATALSNFSTFGLGVIYN
jgi:hypothetical protein